MRKHTIKRILSIVLSMLLITPTFTLYLQAGETFPQPVKIDQTHTTIKVEERQILAAARLAAPEPEEISEADRPQPKPSVKMAYTKEDICSLIDDLCVELGFGDPALIKAIVECESGFRLAAVSKVGAQGLMQIMPRYFKAEMQTYGVSNLLTDIEGNLRIGIEFIQTLIGEFDGDYSRALVAYNGGRSAVYRGVSSNGYSSKVLHRAGGYS